jgi:hypothetical protein
MAAMRLDGRPRRRRRVVGAWLGSEAIGYLLALPSPSCMNFRVVIGSPDPGSIPCRSSSHTWPYL